MPGKHRPSERSGGHKPSSHGHFKHTAKPATLKEVLRAYGLKHSDYLQVRELVQNDLRKVPAHGR